MVDPFGLPRKRTLMLPTAPRFQSTLINPWPSSYRTSFAFRFPDCVEVAWDRSLKSKHASVRCQDFGSWFFFVWDNLPSSRAELPVAWQCAQELQRNSESLTG